jgi:hypothetical protein
MAIPLPNRLIQIAAFLDSTTTSTRLATPGSAVIEGVQCWYQITAIRIRFCALIRSIGAANVPFLDPLWTSKERQDTMANFKLVTPRKGIRLYMQKLDPFSNSPTGRAFVLGDIALYNTAPFYNEETYIFDNLGVQPGWAVFAQSVDMGHGLFSSSEYVDILGVSVEGAEILQDEEYKIIPTIYRA